jgi:transposase InsO family protein
MAWIDAVARNLEGGDGGDVDDPTPDENFQANSDEVIAAPIRTRSQYEADGEQLPPSKIQRRSIEQEAQTMIPADQGENAEWISDTHIQDYLRKESWMEAYSEEERAQGSLDEAGLLRMNDLVVVPDKHAGSLVERMHLIGLMRAPAIKSMIAAWRLHIADLDALIQRIVQSCQGCLAGKPAYAPPLGNIFCGEEPLDVVFLDCTELENRHALVFLDGATKFAYARLVQNMSAEVLEDEMASFIGTFGVPKRITTDNGSQFKSHKFRWLLSWWGIAHAYSVPYVPRTNGVVERAIGTLVSAVRCGYIQRCLSQKQVESIATRDEYLRHSLAEAVLKHNVSNGSYEKMFQRTFSPLCRGGAIPDSGPGHGSISPGTPVMVKISEEQRKGKLSPLFEDQNWKVLRRVGSNQYYLCKRDNPSLVSNVLYGRAQLKPISLE